MDHPTFTKQAFSDAALDCQERLWSYAVRLTRDRAEAEDLLQLTFVRAFENWDKLRTLESISSWLLRSMHRAFIDQCRRRARMPIDPLDALISDELPSSTTGLSARAEARDTVTKAMEGLARPLAQAIALRDVWGFSYDEIAELMDCPIGTVRSRIARARAQMLASIQPGERRHAAAATGGRAS